MKKTYYYNTIAAVLFLTLLSSCESKVGVNEGYDEGLIEFSANVPETKALLNNSDVVNGAQLQLYDVLGDGTAYIDGATATKAGLYWTTASDYKWRRPEHQLEDHSFFGWLINDGRIGYQGVFKNGDADVTPTLDINNGIYTWSVDAVPMRFTYDQFDFCYSNIVKRNAATPDYSPVHLQLNHLFTALGIKFHNYDEGSVTINSIKIYDLTYIKRASISYDTVNGTVTPTYYKEDGEGNPYNQVRAEKLELLARPITIPSDGEVKNVITCAYAGSKPDNQEVFVLMWPQTSDELAGCKLDVEIAGAGTTTLSLKPRNAPAGYSWEPGTKHLIELATRGKTIELTASTAEWDYDARVLNDNVTFKKVSELQFDEMTCNIDPNPEHKKIYFMPGRPLAFNFQIDNDETNATWMIKMSGDIDAFEIDRAELVAGTPGNEGVKYSSPYGDGVSTPTGPIDGTPAYVTINPINPNPAQDYKLQIAIVVRTSTGRLIPLDDILGDYAGYTIIQQKND